MVGLVLNIAFGFIADYGEIAQMNGFVRSCPFFVLCCTGVWGVATTRGHLLRSTFHREGSDLGVMVVLWMTGVYVPNSSSKCLE